MIVIGEMKSFKEQIKSYSLALYFALAFLISWGGILALAGPEGFLGSAEIPADRLPLVYVCMLVGPSLSGLLLLSLTEGRAGWRDLLERLSRWRLGAGWYAAALLTAPLVITALLLLLSRVSPAYLPSIFAAEDRAGLVFSSLVMGLLVGLFEELGWTGFALPRLRLRYGLLASGVITGLLWGAWHMPLFLRSARAADPLPPAVFLGVLLFSFLPPYRVLMTWAYERTGSLLLAALIHAPLSASQLLLIPPTLSATQAVTYDLAFAAVLWALAGVALVWRGDITQRPSVKSTTL